MPDEIKWLEASLKTETVFPRGEVRKVHQTSLHPDEILSHVDSLWSRTSAAVAQQYENIRAGPVVDNFHAILRSVKDPRTPTVEPIPAPKPSVALPATPSTLFLTFDGIGPRSASADPRRRPRPRYSTMRNDLMRRVWDSGGLRRRVTFRRTESTISGRSAYAARIENKLELEKKMLNPDEYFKKRICDELTIKPEWLEENDPKVRFRQNKINCIMESERNSHRAVQILEGYLMNKRRDKLEHESGESNSKLIAKQAENEVGAQLFSVRYELSPKGCSTPVPLSAKTVERANTFASVKVCRRSKLGYTPVSTTSHFVLSPRSMAGSMPKSARGVAGEDEFKKMLTCVAEDLQRDILDLERTTSAGATSNCSGTTGGRRDSKGRATNNEEMQRAFEKHQGLADSIISRAKMETVLKAQHKIVRRSAAALRRKYANK